MTINRNYDKLRTRPLMTINRNYNKLRTRPLMTIITLMTLLECNDINVVGKIAPYCFVMHITLALKCRICVIIN